MFSFEALKSDYTQHLTAFQPTKAHLAAITAKRLLQHRDRFLALQSLCGVPALWVMPVFERENPSFSSYLGNGDPLDHPTTHVPAHRGPFNTWEEGASDALKLDHVDQCPEWTWEGACFEFEKWNGFGPRNHGRPSGYLWSGSNQYLGGKYIADGVWSRGTFDQQLGCVAIAKAIADLDHEIAQGFVDAS
jgi:lysozyme family protein